MQFYEYRCDRCNGHMTTSHRGDRYHADCPHCAYDGSSEGGDGHRRLFSVSIPHVMQEHWNVTTNKPVSSMRQFKDQLKAASDEVTTRTGIESRFVPADMSDKRALGVTV